MTTKNFGISAVSGDLQYGKKGGRIVFDSTEELFKITGADGVTASRIKVAVGVDTDDAVAMSQFNGLSDNIGDLANLDTTEKTTVVGAINEVVSDLGDLQDELDATQLGAGLEVNGTYEAYEEFAVVEDVPNGGAHYIHTATSLKDADKILDEALKGLADQVTAIGTGSIQDLQDELDDTQAGAGLGTDGSYQAETGSNYIDTATSIHNATVLLDTELGNVADEIGDLAALTTTEKNTIVGAINEIDDVIGGLGTMSTQNANDVAITGGSIDGVVIGENGAEDAAFKDVVINGDLTVLGDTVTLDVTNLAVEDNVIRVNRGFDGPVGSAVSGIEVVVDQDAGDDVVGARWVYDLAGEKWVAQTFDTGTSEWVTATIEGNFDGSAVDFGFADDSLILGDSSELVAGSEHQVLTVGDSGLEYAYVTAIRSATGEVVLGQGTVNGSDGEYLEFSSEDDAVYLTARNESGTGDVDLYLSGQGNGDVIISQNASQQGLIIAENNTTLTVSGGNGSGDDAGDIILKGGNADTGSAGDVILQGGTGGGITVIKDTNGNTVSTFDAGDANAVDFTTTKNGVGSVSLEAAGDSSDIDLVLMPKGDGVILAPAGYDIDNADNEALAHKGYVDSAVSAVAANVDPLIMRSVITANSTDSSFTVGTMADVDGKQYFVSRITLHVTTSIVGADHMIVTDGSALLAEESDSDVTTGTYVVDLPFAVATAGGATVSVQFRDVQEDPIVPTAGALVAVVEYKVV